MKQIYLDGEPVTFPDEPPKDLATLLAVLTQHLAQSGRYVAEFYVDDVDLLNAYFDSAPKQYVVIKAVSAPQQEFYKRLVKGRIVYIEELADTLTEFSKRVLVSPWREAISELNQCIQRFTLFVDVIDELKSFVEQNKTAPWAKSLEILVTEYERYLASLPEAIEKADVAKVSDILACEVVPMMQKCQKWLREDVLPYFEKQANFLN